MKHFYLILCLFLTIGISNAKSIDYAKDGFPPLQPVISPGIPSQYSTKEPKTVKNFKKLAKMERKIFNRDFENDELENRISRLEEQVLGTIQSGDINNRYLILQKAVPKYLSRNYTPDISPYCGIPIMSGSSWRGLAGSLGNFFTGGYMMGYPTGLSPQINMPSFNTFSPDFQRANFSNRSWDYLNQNMGTGSSVHILD